MARERAGGVMTAMYGEGGRRRFEKTRRRARGRLAKTASSTYNRARRARSDKTEAWPKKAAGGGGVGARRRTGRGAAAALEIEDIRRRRRRACVRLTWGWGWNL